MFFSLGVFFAAYPRGKTFPVCVLVCLPGFSAVVCLVGRDGSRGRDFETEAKVEVKVEREGRMEGGK